MAVADAIVIVCISGFMFEKQDLATRAISYNDRVYLFLIILSLRAFVRGGPVEI